MLAGAKPQTSASTVHGQGFTEVVFRRRGVLFRLVRLVLFLVVWWFGLLFGVALMGAGGGQTAWFFPVWLAGWGLGGLVFAFALLWSALGVESLIARSESLTLVRRLLLLRRPVVMPAASITDLRWVPDDPGRIVRVNGRRIPQTSIAIVSTERTVSCAAGIGEQDAFSAIRELRQRLVIPRRREQ